MIVNQRVLRAGPENEHGEPIVFYAEWQRVPLALRWAWLAFTDDVRIVSWNERFDRSFHIRIHLPTHGRECDEWALRIRMEVLENSSDPCRLVIQYLAAAIDAHPKFARESNANDVRIATARFKAVFGGECVPDFDAYPGGPRLDFYRNHERRHWMDRAPAMYAWTGGRPSE